MKMVKFLGLLYVLAFCMVFTTCQLDVAEKKPEPPVNRNLTQQPVDTTIAKSNTMINVVPLSVIANVPQGATAGYQWYSNTTKSNKDGTIIDGATNSTYLPPFTIDTPAGQYFYYVVVTIRESSSGTSVDTVSVAVVYTITTEPETFNNTVAVDIGTKYQYVRGFGGSAIIWSNFTDDTVADYELMHNPNGPLGYNMCRIMLPPDSTNIDDTMTKLLKNVVFPHPRGCCRYGGNWWYEDNDIPPPRHPNGQEGKDNSDYYDIVKKVNQHGGYVFASPWSPPGDWKNNKTFQGTDATPGISDHLLPEHYGDFANYLKRFAEIMYENGAPLYSVSLQNEHTWHVDYEGCMYNSTQHQNFWITQGHYMSKDTAPGNAGYKSKMSVVPGWGGGRAIPSVRPMSGEAHNGITGAGDLGSVIENTAGGNQARQGYDILARHIYGASTPTPSSFLNLAQFHPTDPKEVWQTEWSTSGTTTGNEQLAYTWNYVWVIMNAIDFTIRLNNESAFIWFPSKSFDAMIGSGGTGTTLGDILPRGYALSHFAKYAKETGRVGLTVTGTNASAANPSSNRDTNNTSSQWRAPKLTAYVTLNDEFYDGPVESRHRRWRGVNDSDGGIVIGDLDVSKISAISFIMYTPTNYQGTEGTNMGTIKVVLPDNFKIGRAIAIRSSNGNYHSQESVIIGADGSSAFVNLPASNVVSVRFDKAQ